MDFIDRLTAYLQSAIVRQQLVALVAATAALFGFAPDVEVLGVQFETVIAGLLAAIPVVTLLTRVFKPAPNLSQTAADKERQLRGAGVITADGKFAHK